MKSFSKRLAQLEALEQAQQPGPPSYVCLHAADYAALDDATTPAELRQAIAEAYQLSGDQQKLYVGICCCWGVESCRVCSDQPWINQNEEL
jgi:hypothetical protein